MALKYVFNPLEGILDAVLSLESPLQFKGEINANSDFPTSAEVESGWFYTIGTDVTDDDPAKTNTGLSFEAGDEIAWDGSTWIVIGTNIWKRDGTTISPRTSGDDLDLLTGSLSLEGDITSGDGGSGDSVIRFMDTGSLAYQIGYDDTESKFIIANGVFDGTNHLVTFDGTTMAINPSGGSTNEVEITANEMNFVTGGTDVGFGWSLSGVFGFKIGGVGKLAILSTALRPSTNGDISCGDTTSRFGGVFSDDSLNVYNGSDSDHNLIEVGVTGTPTLAWNETDDRFDFSHGINIDVASNREVSIAADSMTFNNGAVDTSLVWSTSGILTVAVGGTGKLSVTSTGVDVMDSLRTESIRNDGDAGGVASTTSFTNATDTPTSGYNWDGTGSSPDGYIKAYLGTQAIVLPYWNT